MRINERRKRSAHTGFGADKRRGAPVRSVPNIPPVNLSIYSVTQCQRCFDVDPTLHLPPARPISSPRTAVATQTDMSGSCENYGTPNGTSCTCPPGFGGSTCSQPACGGTIFQGSGRSLANGSPFANLTSSGCSCEDGWTGTGCNVCQTAKACQSGFASVAGTAGSLTGASTGQNNTIVCNDVPRVYAAGEMSCDVQVSPNFSVLVSLNGRVDV